MPSQSACSSWVAFLESQDLTRKKSLSQAIRLCDQFVSFSCTQYGTNKIPEIRINNSDVCKSAGAYYAPEGNIYLYSGLISFLEAISESDNKPINQETYAFLLWTVSHELSHHIQKHLTIRNKLEGGVKGTEFDADRLAAIMVFDYIKHTNWGREKSNLEIKRGILTTLFSPMRIKSSKDMEIKTADHPPWALRILYTATVLASQGTNGLSSEESRDTVKNLFNLISNLENAYKHKSPEDTTDLNFYIQNYAQVAFESTLKDFEIIRPYL